MNTETDKELDLLLNSEKELRFGNKKVIIHKISMIDSIKLASHLSVLANAVVNNSETAARALTLLKYTDTTSSEEEASAGSLRLLGLAQILSLIGNEGANIIADIVEKCTNLTYEEIDNFPAEDGLDLLFEIYEVNKSFFTKFSQKLDERMQKSKKSAAKKKKA